VEIVRGTVGIAVVNYCIVLSARRAARLDPVTAPRAEQGRSLAV
jgi:hypothetical protein